MAVTGRFPKHLEVAARTGILIARPDYPMPWRQVAMELNLTAASTQLVDVGSVPAPTQKPQVSAELIERAMAITPQDWYLTLRISQNDIDDDQTGTLERQFKNLRPAFDKHINARVFKVLNAGDGSTYGLCYDESDFFDDDHVDKGAEYQTSQVNEAALAISPDNFNTAYIAATTMRDDAGEFVQFVFDLLVTHPTNNKVAANICANPQESGTADRDINPHAGNFTYLLSPEFDTTAWHIIASKESTKPLLVGIRKQPQLNDMWFDAQQEKGGIHYIQYHGRYVVAFADWRLAYQGNT